MHSPSHSHSHSGSAASVASGAASSSVPPLPRSAASRRAALFAEMVIHAQSCVANRRAQAQLDAWRARFARSNGTDGEQRERGERGSQRSERGQRSERSERGGQRREGGGQRSGGTATETETARRARAQCFGRARSLARREGGAHLQRHLDGLAAQFARANA